MHHIAEGCSMNLHEAHLHTRTEARRRLEEMAERKTPLPVGETPSEKFRRLGNYRLKKALAAMDSLSKLASPFYGATDTQREKVVTILQKGVEKVAAAFGDSAPSEDSYLR